MIDTEAGKACSKNERPISWTAAPVASRPDSFVALRSEEVTLPQGRTVIGSLLLQPGKYEVTAKVFVFNTSATTTPGVSCQSTPSSSDGTPGDSGGPTADPAAFELAPAGQGGSAGAMSLGVTQEFDVAGGVVLDCFSHNVDVASPPQASNAWIRAMVVGSITTSPAMPPQP